MSPKEGAKRAYLLADIDFSGIDLKPCRRLRNYLEHFDERLDSWVANYDGHAFFDSNIVTGTQGFPKKVFLHALDGDVFKFHGEDCPVQPLCDAVEEMHLRLASSE